jgi:hypothetical protein
VTIIHAIVLLLLPKELLFVPVVLLTLVQVMGDNPKEAIVKVIENKKLDET